MSFLFSFGNNKDKKEEQLPIPSHHNTLNFHDSLIKDRTMEEILNDLMKRRTDVILRKLADINICYRHIWLDNYGYNCDVNEILDNKRLIDMKIKMMLELYEVEIKTIDEEINRLRNL